MDQQLLLPPALKDWLPEDHLVFFILEMLEQMDLSEIYESYDGSKGGKPPYNPTMMTNLLFYGYCTGVFSSRTMEKSCYEQVPFLVLTGDQQPENDTIAEFSRRHMTSLTRLFVQGLQLFQNAGCCKLGHSALDGTKGRDKGASNKAMSYKRMEKKALELRGDVTRLMKEAQSVDEQEDQKYGKGKRGDEIPEDLRFKKSRLKKIREAMAGLEAEAKVEANEKREAIQQKEEALTKQDRKR